MKSRKKGTKKNKRTRRKKRTRKKRGGSNHCSICLKEEEIEDDSNHIRLSCGHVFCRNCINIVERCPLCRLPIDQRIKLYL